MGTAKKSDGDMVSFKMANISKWRQLERLNKLELHLNIVRENSDNKAYLYIVSDKYDILAKGKCKTLREAKKKASSITSYIIEHGSKSYLEKYGEKKSK